MLIDSVAGGEMLGLVRAIVIYGLIFTFFAGTPYVGVLQILYPITASSIYIGSTYAAFINVTSPVTMPLLAFSVQNGSASLQLLNSTSMIFAISSTHGINVTVWSVPSPYQILINSSPITLYPNASYVYDPLYQRLTILIPGAFNDTTLTILFAPITSTAPAAASITVNVGVTLSSVTKVYPNRFAQAAVDAVLILSLTLVPIAYVITRGFGRRSLLVSAICTIGSAVLMVLRADIVDYIYIVNGTRTYVYMTNPWGYLYIVPLAISIVLGIISLLFIIRRAVLSF